MGNIEAISKWQELGVTLCIMQFDCGGDSMGSTSFEFLDREGNQIVSAELEGFFVNEVYNNVEFYECSDGHYIGESGTVEITLGEEDFEYIKASTSEYNESFTESAHVPLSRTKLDFIAKNIKSISGSDFGKSIIYLSDLILTDEEIELVDDILSEIDDFAQSYQHDVNADASNEYSFTWDRDEHPISDDDEHISVNITASYYIYTNDLNLDK